MELEKTNMGDPEEKWDDFAPITDRSRWGYKENSDNSLLENFLKKSYE